MTLDVAGPKSEATQPEHATRAPAAGAASFSNRVFCGDALAVLQSLPSRLADVCITSPPYWSLRDYGVDGQYGLEDTPEDYAKQLVQVFREVRRVLKPEGTLWLVLGDTYYSGAGRCRSPGGRNASTHPRGLPPNRRPGLAGLRPKDLVGVPWRTALALQSDGWWLRNAIIWFKPNALPTPTKDRLSCRYEHVFLFTISPRYHFNLDAIRESHTKESVARVAAAHRSDGKGKSPPQRQQELHRLGISLPPQLAALRSLSAYGKNPGDVWNIPTTPSRFAHHAAFPDELVRRAILAGSSPGGLILDPFCGTGTTLRVARDLGRHYLGVELHPRFVEMATSSLRREAA